MSQKYLILILLIQSLNSVDEIKYEKGQTIKENSIVTIKSKYNGSNDILKKLYII